MCGLTATLTGFVRPPLDQTIQNPSGSWAGAHEALSLEEELLVTDVWWGRERGVFFRNLAVESVLSYTTQIQAVKTGLSVLKKKSTQSSEGKKCQLIGQELERRK